MGGSKNLSYRNWSSKTQSGLVRFPDSVLLDQIRYDKFFEPPMKFALVSEYGGSYIVIEVIAIEWQFQVLITESNYLASESVSRI